MEVGKKRHLTFLGAPVSVFRAGQLMGLGQGAQGAWGHEQDTQPLQGARTSTEPRWPLGSWQRQGGCVPCQGLILLRRVPLTAVLQSRAVLGLLPLPWPAQWLWTFYTSVTT